MKRNFVTILALVLTLAILMFSCKKEDVKKETNTNNGNGNTEIPGGDDNPGGGDQDGSTPVILPNAVTDIDGNQYNAVMIGGQVWMKENLRTRHFADGGFINEGSNSPMSDEIPLRYAHAQSDPIYGYLYNWAAVMHGASSSNTKPSGVQGICPDGWHVPSQAEWEQLVTYMEERPEYNCDVEAYTVGKAMAADYGWDVFEGYGDGDASGCEVGYNQSTNNYSGFSALPAGGYYYDMLHYTGNGAFFYTATLCPGTISSYGAFYYSLYSDMSGVGKNFGTIDCNDRAYAVRCVRD